MIIIEYCMYVKNKTTHIMAIWAGFYLPIFAFMFQKSSFPDFIHVIGVSIEFTG